MKNKIPYIIIAILLAILWFKSCSKFQNGTNNQSNKHEIKTPETKGSFEPKDSIKHEPIKLPSNKNNQFVDVNKMVQNEKLKNDIAKLYSEMEMQQKAFAQESDSLKRIILYNKATQLNEFHQEYEDDKLYLLASGLVAGSEVKQLGFNYTIKKQSITIPETKFRLLAGGSVGNTLDFQNPLFSAGIGFQNKKGSILLGSFDTEKRISIGYYQSIFKVKK